MLNVQDESYNAPSQPVNNHIDNPKKRNTLLKVLFVFAISLTLVCGVAVLGYSTFLPAKQTLMAAGYASNIKSYNYIDKHMSLYEKKYIEPLMNSTIQKAFRAGISLDKSLLEQFLPSDYADEIAGVINNIAFKYDYAFDLNNKKRVDRFGLSYLLNPILTLRMSLDGNKFALSADEFTKKTITGDIKDLGKLSELFPDTPSDYWDTMSNIDPWIMSRVFEEIKIDKKELKNLIFDYSSELISSIDSDNMSIKRGLTTEVLGKNVKCQEITIKLDVELQKKVALNLIKKMQNDDSFYNTTIGNLLKYFDILSENQYYKQAIDETGIMDILSKDNFKKELSKTEDEIEDIEFGEDIKAIIYIDGLDIVKYVFLSEEAENDTLLTIEQDIKDLSSNSRLTIKSDMGGDSINMVLGIRNNYDKRNDISDFAMELSTERGQNGNTSKFSISIESDEEISNKNEVDHTFSAVIKAEGANFVDMDKATFNINLDGTKTRNTGNQIVESDYKGDFSFHMPTTMPNPIKIGFYAKTDTSYGEEVKIPEYTQVLDIRTATQEDYYQLMLEIENNFYTLLQLAGGF